MSQNLQIQVLLSAVDKLTAPFRSASKASEKLSNALTTAKKELKSLEKTQSKMDSWQRLNKNIAKATEQMSKHKAKLESLRNKASMNKGIRSDLLQKINAEKRNYEFLSKQQAAHLAKNNTSYNQVSVGMINSLHKLQQLEKQYAHIADVIGKNNKKIRAEKSLLKENQRAKVQQYLVLREIRTKLKEAGIDTKQFAMHESELKRKIDAANKSISKQEERLKQLNHRQKEQQRYQQQVQKVKAGSDWMAGFGQRSMMHGASMLGAGGLMLKPAVDFEKDFSRVQALTRLDKIKDAKRIKALRDQAIDLGANTAFTSAEVAQGQGYLAMAGFTDKQILASMPNVLNMSLALGVDLARVSDVASDISSGFKIPAEQMGRVADVLTLTFTTSNTSLETLYETMKEGAPIMTALGQSMETTAAMTGLLGNVGIKGSNAGTALKNIGLNMINNKHLKELGVRVQDKKGNMRQIPQILSEIKKKTDKMGTAERGAVLKSILGKIPIASAIELISQADGVLQKYESSLKDAEGTVNKVSQTMTDNLMGDLKALESAKEALGISVYDTISESLRSFVQIVLQHYGKLMNGQKPILHLPQVLLNG